MLSLHQEFQVVQDDLYLEKHSFIFSRKLPWKQVNFLKIILLSISLLFKSGPWIICLYFIQKFIYRTVISVSMSKIWTLVYEYFGYSQKQFVVYYPDYNNRKYITIARYSYRTVWSCNVPSFILVKVISFEGNGNDADDSHLCRPCTEKNGIQIWKINKTIQENLCLNILAVAAYNRK